MLKTNYPKMQGALKMNRVVILPPQDMKETLKTIDAPVTTTIVDPWYNKGVGDVRGNYID